jgi:hypothetical protein
MHCAPHTINHAFVHEQHLGNRLADGVRHRHSLRHALQLGHALAYRYANADPHCDGVGHGVTNVHPLGHGHNDEHKLAHCVAYAHPLRK